jgi:hypothetical protein
MRRIALALGLLAALAACEGREETFAAECQKVKRLKKSECECAAAVARKTLSKKEFDYLNAGVRGDDAAKKSITKGMGVSERVALGLKIASFWTRAVTTCAGK